MTLYKNDEIEEIKPAEVKRPRGRPRKVEGAHSKDKEYKKQYQKGYYEKIKRNY